MLHVTNGTSVSLADTGLGGEILTWEDVLHEGPVPGGLPLEELSRVRGKYLDAIWPGAHAVDHLASRDQRLSHFTEHEEVTLWFEHDLYDQLQLIQILDWFHGRSPGRLTLICVDEYLGPLTGSQLAAFWPNRRPVTAVELDLAADAWKAFRSADPTSIEDLLRRDTSALPFLAGALRRHLQQFPAVENGLSRTERQILELVDAGHRDLHALFRGDQRMEERIFMGDTSFELHLRGLCDCRYPLLAEADRRYQLTPLGRDVAAARADHVRLNGINRWLGGVHLNGSEALWRWSESQVRLVAH
jgi:hypothetical protein